MLVDLVRQLAHEILVELLLGLLDFSKEVHYVSFATVGNDAVGFFNHLLGDVDVSAHVLAAHLLEFLLLVLKLSLNS